MRSDNGRMPQRKGSPPAHHIHNHESDNPCLVSLRAYPQPLIRSAIISHNVSVVRFSLVFNHAPKSLACVTPSRISAACISPSASAPGRACCRCPPDEKRHSARTPLNGPLTCVFARKRARRDVCAGLGMAGALLLLLRVAAAAAVVEVLLGAFSLGEGGMGQMASSGIVSGEKGVWSGFGE